MLEVKETFKNVKNPEIFEHSQKSKIFDKEVKGIKDYVLLVTVDAKSYQKTAIDAVKFLVSDQGTPGVYVTLNEPYEIIQRILANNNVDSRLVIFIDATSRAEGSKRIENCLYLGS